MEDKIETFTLQLFKIFSLIQKHLTAVMIAAHAFFVSITL